MQKRKNSTILFDERRKSDKPATARSHKKLYDRYRWHGDRRCAQRRTGKNGYCEPFPDALETLNRWYDQGHIICFFTSRTEEHRGNTEIWLKKHGFKHHGVLFGKPRGGNYHWIDNHIVRATKYKGKFTDLVTQTKNVELFEE